MIDNFLNGQGVAALLATTVRWTDSSLVKQQGTFTIRSEWEIFAGLNGRVHSLWPSV